ncbi:MAG: flavodoxin-dependent (E)-4-hydroxy-3-methylbut-2-enyl-diphosphate synthase [Clostridia bacterium]|nr:flavodoxin-dependent (E)-4-hydroxy-3-methylbut-2-enyl-diphosphate synthase [Clostridia bacterium]
MNYNDIRRITRQVKVGNVYIGGNAPISVQSMTNTDTHDAEATYKQVSALEKAGADIVRIALPDISAARTIAELKERGVSVPLVADIHFDYKIALAAADAGVDKIRINPGNIGADENVKAVAQTCKSKNIPIRIGVNSGSLEPHILKEYGAPTPEALAKSALYHAGLLERYDFDDIVISIKSSHVAEMKKASEIVANECNYPLHIGVTESGRGESGLIKSAAGIGSLLLSGIGDTIRISLTDDPVREIYYGKKLLRSLELTDEKYINVISCPTCGRTKIDLIKICEEVEKRLPELGNVNKKLTVAVMGCAVNGPGEAREADIGIAGGDHEALLFSHGKIIRKIPETGIVDELFAEIRKLI